MRKSTLVLVLAFLTLPVCILAQSDGSVPQPTETPSPTVESKATPVSSPIPTAIPAQGVSVPRISPTPTAAVSESPIPSPLTTPRPTPESSGSMSYSPIYLVTALMALIFASGGWAIYKAKIKKNEEGDKCDSIKELLEQKKKELEEMIKNWPEEKLKSMATEKVLGEFKKNEDAKKIIETAESLKAKKDKLKETIEMLQKQYNICMLEFPLAGSPLKGTIVENSLKDRGVLKDIKIKKTYQGEDWTLHDVFVDEEKIDKLGTYLDEGPWYMNFWREGSDDMWIVFKDKKFRIKYSDKNTWTEAVDYGKSMGIPEEQLDFAIK